jgi:uncharacterized linocin/CFP29 family protein
MSDDLISWGDAEWSRIRQAVHDEALRTRVAASFLPLYGPLPASTVSVPLQTLGMALSEGDAGRQVLEVDDYTTKRLASVAVNVRVKNHMLADPELEAATMLFRRAAGIVARIEDEIVFCGKNPATPIKVPGVPEVYTVGGDPSYAGLVDAAAGNVTIPTPKDPTGRGPAVFEAVVQAVLDLERAGWMKPFAVVLGADLFRDIHAPMPGSMVLPRDSIPPFTDGPLLRSGCLAPTTGIVTSLQGNPVEIVVPADISVRYLQADLDGGHVFRVSQRFLLRIKDATAIVRLSR